MIQREINSIYQIFQSIAQAEIHITITQGPGDIAPQFILEALDVLTLIFGDVIRIPGKSEAQTIIGRIASLQETSHIRPLEIGVMAMGSMIMVSVGMSLMTMPLVPMIVMVMSFVIMIFVVVIPMSLVLVFPPRTIMLLMIMAIMVMMIVLCF